ncbi:transcriptional regulator [Streptomyces flavofungini]|uniref:Helix-turn-helix domain-containing protein n=1 Tax=Streptomyces flavofungini TaxID=68200 RepID=A0ABS0X2C4_9ACTN|nr:helix-turn-helix domain-containing protein [Streptomyces flavofungini]GHC66128.1 transcriptional regulator [Streptomyces flavofungini]
MPATDPKHGENPAPKHGESLTPKRGGNPGPPNRPVHPAEARRRDLGAFLRSRRERIAPDQVGLPRTGRRRTPGLRREELVLLAGISATWYTYLEQGRDIRVSEQVLTALATTLRLDPHERGHLFHLAGHTSAAEPTAPAEPLPPEAAAVPHLLQPNPAYIIGGTYDVLSHNQAAADLFPNLTAPTEHPPNLARWVFLDPAARHTLVDWEPEARGLLARLRTLTTHHPEAPHYRRLIDDLHTGSAEVRAWWPQHEVQPRHSGHKRLRAPDGQVTEFAYTAFHSADHPTHTLVIYTPLKP